MNEQKIKISKEKREEFNNKMMNYSTWRWSGVSLYQSAFIVFLTAAILLLVDIIAENDRILKAIILIILIFLSLDMYKKMLRQASKPIFVCENMVATVEKGPHNVKAEDGQVYSVFSISNAVHDENKKELKNDRLDKK